MRASASSTRRKSPGNLSPAEFYDPKKIPRLKGGTTVDTTVLRADRDAAVRRFAERVGTEILVMSERRGAARTC